MRPSRTLARAPASTADSLPRPLRPSLSDSTLLLSLHHHPRSTPALALALALADGVAGIVGLVFTGVFAQAEIAALDGYTAIPGGWLDGNYIVVGYQFAYICAVWGWCVSLSLPTRTAEEERA